MMVDFHCLFLHSCISLFFSLDDNNTYVSKMVTMVQTNGDYDKLMQGCFENYPTMTFHDTAMSKVVECGDWLAFFDQLNTRVSTNFEYEVGGYMAYALVAFHRFFAGSVRQKIEYPRKDYEVMYLGRMGFV